MVGYALPISVPINAIYTDMFCEVNTPGSDEWQKILEGVAGNISGFDKV